MNALLFFLGLIVSYGFSQETTTAPSTTFLGCPGGSIVYQDIAILYDLTYSPYNESLAFSQQIQEAIYKSLFVGPAYWYDEFNGRRISQVTLIPYSNTRRYIFNDLDYYGTINSVMKLKETLDRQLKHAGIPYIGHPTESLIHEALNYLITYIQDSRRPYPVENTVVIISKRDADVPESQPLVDVLKNTSKVVTIGVGNSSIASLSTLATDETYSFTIKDITDYAVIDGIAQAIADKLATDCGITFTAPPTTTTPTRPTVATTSPTLGTTITRESTTVPSSSSTSSVSTKPATSTSGNTINTTISTIPISTSMSSQTNNPATKTTAAVVSTTGNENRNSTSHPRSSSYLFLIFALFISYFVSF